MQSKATTVKDYLAELPADRREAIQAVREVILKNLGKDYEEGMQYGMIGYYVPHRVFPAGYHCDPRQPLPFASLASQKNHMAVYLMCVYADEGERKAFEQAWTKAGKKLDMGKSCIRFKKVEELALDVLGQAIRRVPVQKHIEYYQASLQGVAPRNATTKRPAAKKTAASKSPSKKASAKSSSKLHKKKAARSTR